MYTRKLASVISEKYSEISEVFSQYQKTSGLICPSGCGKCCFKADISCAPIELLPMAFHLIDKGQAEEVLEKARVHKEDHCFFLEVSNRDLGTGQCREYEHRPFICRAFGVSARHGKNNSVERSMCKTLAVLATSKNIPLINEEMPFIDSWKKKLESLDFAFMQKEMPINQALVLVLEKLLLANSYQEKN